LTLNPEPLTLNPEPLTLNPELLTLNPEPLTLNPESLPFCFLPTRAPLPDGERSHASRHGLLLTPVVLVGGYVPSLALGWQRTGRALQGDALLPLCKQVQVCVREAVGSGRATE